MTDNQKPNDVKARILKISVAVVLFSLVVLRMTSCTTGDMSQVHHSEINGNEGIISFRMSRPFELQVSHVLQRPLNTEDQGLVIDPTPSERSEEVAAFSSSYDWLRGGHRVTVYLSVDNGEAVLKGDGQTVNVSPWSDTADSIISWQPYSESARYGDGIGITMGRFESAEDVSDELWMYPTITPHP